MWTRSIYSSGSSLIPLFSLVLLAVLKTTAFGVDAEYRSVVFENGIKIRAELAQTPEARQRGLMFRETLPEGSGMLFIFEREAPYRFWMKNCRIALDLIWLNKKKEVVYIAENQPPCKADPCPDFGPTSQNALYVVEAAAGFVKKSHITEGMKARF